MTRPKKNRTIDVKCTIPDTRPWFKGEPASPGWYEASVQKRPSLYRWWDGQIWSVYAIRSMTAEQAAARARLGFWYSQADTMYWREIEV